MYEGSDFIDPNATRMAPHSTRSSEEQEYLYCFTQTGPENVGLNAYLSFNDGSGSNHTGGSNQDLSFVDHRQQQLPATPDLLNLLQFPPSSGIKVPPFPSYLNLQAPPFALRAGYVFGLGGGEGNIDGDFEFAAQDLGCKKKRGGRRGKQFPSTTTERQRRVDLSTKFDALKDLIPNPTKNDRASVVEDANNYIRELVRTVNELKLLAEKKRYEKQRVKRHKKVVEATAEESEQQEAAKGSPPPLLQDHPGDDRHSYIESLRSSWIQRKSKETEVDVRIIDDEVTVKLVQRKRNSFFLVHASHVLDELNLDLQHVAGGRIGDFCSFMFNSKVLICEGSSVYASAIANKLIEAMDTTSGAI